MNTRKATLQDSYLKEKTQIDSKGGLCSTKKYNFASHAEREYLTGWMCVNLCVNSMNQWMISKNRQYRDLPFDGVKGQLLFSPQLENKNSTEKAHREPLTNTSKKDVFHIQC